MSHESEVRATFYFQCRPEHIVRERERGGRGVTETFTIPFTLDASAAIAAGNPAAVQYGLHPELALLDQMFREAWLLLWWGPSRVIPMTPIALNVTETVFDEALNPIPADNTLQAERITLTTDARLGRYVNAGAETASTLSKLYDGGPPPEIKA